jgi:hypothetical protein
MQSKSRCSILFLLVNCYCGRTTTGAPRRAAPAGSALRRQNPSFSYRRTRQESSPHPYWCELLDLLYSMATNRHKVDDRISRSSNSATRST